MVTKMKKAGTKPPEVEVSEEDKRGVQVMAFVRELPPKPRQHRNRTSKWVELFARVREATESGVGVDAAGDPLYAELMRYPTEKGGRNARTSTRKAGYAAGFQLQHRVHDDGTSSLYARWTGEADGDEGDGEGDGWEDEDGEGEGEGEENGEE